MLLHQLLPSQHPHEKRLLPPAKNSGGVRESGRSWPFFLPGPNIRVLANLNGGGIKAVYHLYGWQFGVL